jgi:hypothetical protein
VSTPRTRAPQAVERLRQSLETVADAITDASVSGLLGAEAQISAALASVNGIVDVTAADRPALLAELKRAQAALARCRNLGVAVGYVTDAVLFAHGRQDPYDRAGLAVSPMPSASSMDVRV